MQIFIASLDPSHSRARLPAPVRAGLLFVMAVLVLASAAAQARVRWVGDSNNCEYHTIDQAISAAGSSSGPDEVRITKDHPSGEWHGQALSITDQDLTIGGNWDYCGQPDADYEVGYGVLSGFGGAQASVITIRGRSQVNLYGLKITLGDPPSSMGANAAGGIDFEGKGSLYLRAVILQYNIADVGGGIRAACDLSVSGSSCADDPYKLIVTLGDNVYVYDNEARLGGGVSLDQRSKLVMKDAYTFFHRNSAWEGGAIYIGNGSTAEIGSPQPTGTAGVFFKNTAHESGGAIFAYHQADYLQSPIILYSVSASEPLSFVENLAPYGAAISVRNQESATPMTVCSTHVEYRRNKSTGGNIDPRFADEPISGSVVDVRGQGASFEVNSDDCLFQLPPEGQFTCAPLDQTHCDTFAENQVLSGSLFSADIGGNIYLRRVRVYNNAAPVGLYAMGGAPRESVVSIHDSVIDHNELVVGVAAASFKAVASITNVTIAENQISTYPYAAVLTSYGSGQIFAKNSIIDHEQSLFTGQIANSNFSGLLVRNPGSYPLPVGNVVGRPSYIPGFYRLQPYSEGIDRVMVTPGLTDPDGTPRSIDNVNANNIPGYYADIGAYESTATSIPPGADTIFASSFE